MTENANPGAKSGDEADYLRRLTHARRMFAWCLTTYGAVAAPEAEREAEQYYPYEGSDRMYRLHVFHDAPWHYAMQRLHGDMYWVRDRALESPTAEYAEEAARLLVLP
jgi:hypothetical protein